jgi:hypothetical protein
LPQTAILLTSVDNCEKQVNSPAWAVFILISLF